MTPVDDADEGTVTWRDLQAEAESRLRRAGLPTASSDARWIIEEVSGLDGPALVLGGDEAVTVRAVAAFDDMIARREAGEPLQYVLGRWAFRGLDLLVDKRVLIPRPETESLVDLVLDAIDRIADHVTGPVTVVDLGTGSGAIGLSVAAERAGTQVWLTDQSADALAVARANLAGIGRSGARVRITAGDWFAALPDDLLGTIAVVASNPPYVPSEDVLPADVVEWEPGNALFAGPDGLDDLRRLVGEAPRWLMPAGTLVVELDPRQAAKVADLMSDAGFMQVGVHQDLVGRDRFVSGRRP